MTGAEKAYYSEIGETFRKIRSSKGVTQTELAAKMEIASTVLSAFERGEEKLSAYRIDQGLRILTGKPLLSHSEEEKKTKLTLKLASRNSQLTA